MEKKPTRQPSRPSTPPSRPRPSSPCNEGRVSINFNRMPGRQEATKSYSTGPSGDKKK